MLDYMRMNRDEFTSVVDRHRNPELWTKEGGEWRLRYPFR